MTNLKKTTPIVNLTRIIFLAVIFFCACSPCFAVDEIETIKKQYTEVISQQRGASAEQIKTWFEKLNENGYWEDINYKDRNKSIWDTRNHIKRLLAMSAAYRQKGHKYYESKDLKKAIVAVTNHWVEKNYRNPNWWHNDIAIPKDMAATLVIMGEDIPKELVDRAIKTVLDRIKIKMSGQNRLWFSGIVFLRSLLVGDKETMKVARDNILAQIKVTTQEGVQADWCFHQHGHQIQTGVYGLSFLDSCTTWADILKGTSFALSDEQVQVLRNFSLLGASRVIWNGYMDISFCGRQIKKGSPVGKAEYARISISRMGSIDPDNKKLYEKCLEDMNKPEGGTLTGNYYFWRSDAMVQRNQNWYASVKMSSFRMKGAESCNRENMRGIHLGDGVLYVYLTGKEYENIMPVWDWHRLPGTTCDQSNERIFPKSGSCRSKSRFAGGISTGEIGVAAMIYKREIVTAKKSWFFLGDRIICLGSGISAKDSGVILTSVQQSLKQGEVIVSGENFTGDSKKLSSQDWVLHGGIGYRSLDDKPLILKADKQPGDWNIIFRYEKKSPIEKDVFSLWFDHGKSPEGASYAYEIYPNSNASEMTKYVTTPKYKILKNTPEMQVVSATDGNRLLAVMYEPGTLTWGDRTIKISAPCIINFENSEKGIQMAVADPTWKLESIDITIDNKTVNVKLPAGGDKGNTLKMDLDSL